MFNKESGYGRMLAQALSGVVPTALGRVFLVGATSLPNIAFAQEIFKGDPRGVDRLHATLTLALAQCTASAGDVILVLPGHTETVSTSTALTVSKAGVTIVGLGRGSLRPTLTLDTGTGATINVTAANVRFLNCLFVANFAAIVSCFTTTTAQELVLENCEFRDTASNLNFVNIVDTDATSNHTDGLTILNCKRIGAGATTNTTIVKMDGTNDRLTIKGCNFAHRAITGGGLMIIATGKIVTNADIVDNKINLVGATNLATGILITTDGSTNSGWLDGNKVNGLDDTGPILVTASSGFLFGLNYYGATADASAFLLPAAGS